MNRKRSDGVAFSIASVFGACMGFIGGVRRLDPSLDQDLYWIWLSIWVLGGAALGVAGMSTRKLFERP